MINAGHPQAPLTKWSADSVLPTNLAHRVTFSPTRKNCFAREKEGGSKPVGLLFLLLAEVTDEKETVGRGVYPVGYMTQMNVRDLMHEVVPLPRLCVSGIQYDG